MTAPDRRSRRTLLWQWLWRRPVVRRVFYEVIGLFLLRRRSLQMLNCGYCEPGYPEIGLGPESEAERPGFQLYHRLARTAPLSGADLLEVGCGRGGGAQFLSRHFEVRSYWATDFSRLFTITNRIGRGSKVLRFKCAPADRVPFREKSFDCALAVEAVHPLRDKAAFLGEMARVLRPGGRLLIADFFYARDSSPSALRGFREVIRASAFTLEAEEDWTRHALQAMEAGTPRRIAEIRRLPRIFHNFALSFASTVASPLYDQLRDGRATYAHFSLLLRGGQESGASENATA